MFLYKFKLGFANILISFLFPLHGANQGRLSKLSIEAIYETLPLYLGTSQTLTASDQSYGLGGQIFQQQKTKKFLRKMLLGGLVVLKSFTAQKSFLKLQKF